MFRRYFWIALLAFQVITLAACAPTQPNIANVQNTAIAIAYTGFALTQTALPAATPLPPTFTPTATVVYPAPSLIPTQPPPPIFTPDTIQVKRWREYQTELAKVMTCDAGHDCPNFGYALCEWDILGRSGREVYVWAVCPGNNKPAVIYLEADGSIRKVETPENSTDTGPAQMSSMFPADVREKFGLYTGYSMFYGREKEMIDHLNYREIHPEEPPLIVLSAMPTAIPSP